MAAADDADEFDVIIVGYGPTGQSAASLLSRLGHRVCVLERWPSLYGLPRLCSLDGEAARIVQASGNVDEALRESSHVRRYDFTSADGGLLMSVDHVRRVCGFFDRIAMFQPDVEDAMDAGARARGAQINQGWEVTGLTEDAYGVEVTAIRHRRGYEGTEQEPPRTVRGKFLIGADGGRSRIRTILGAEREDLGFYDAFLSVDIKRKRQLDIPDDMALTCCDPRRNISRIPIGPSRMRFEFLVNPDDDHTELLTPDVGYDFLKTAWGLTPDDVEIYRQVVYKFEGKIAHNWRHGRVLLAGDAAHLMPPFAGQGACSGLRDSINLAWKLDLVLRGVTDMDLLDSYTEERRPHVHAVTVRSIALGKVACVRDPEEAALRDQRLRGGDFPVGPSEHPSITTGILHRDGGSVPSLPAGELIPQGIVRLDGETGRFDDVVGWGFVLLGRGTDPSGAVSPGQRAFLDRVGCIASAVSTDQDSKGIVDVDGDYERFFAQHDVEFVLARPDFTVFGGARSAGELPALVGDLREQLRAV
jgi:3-(3-hydroxy-phenyl)propionate hydroxylase